MLALVACRTEPVASGGNEPPPEPLPKPAAAASSEKAEPRPRGSLSVSTMAREKGILLPRIQGTAAKGADSLPLMTLTKTELLVGETHIADVIPGPLGFDAKIKRMEQRSALQLMPLDAALRPIHAAHPEESSLRVLVDRSTAYRSALEAVFTAAQTGFTTFFFVVSSAQGESAVMASTPSKAEWEAAHTAGAPQPPSFVLDTSGVTLTVGTVRIGADCTKGKEGVAVPTLDATAVAACAKKVHAMSPEWSALMAANVTAAPELEMQVVLGIVAGIESTYATVHFGMMTR